jgi:hypothetical protein
MTGGRRAAALLQARLDVPLLLDLVAEFDERLPTDDAVGQLRDLARHAARHWRGRRRVTRRRHRWREEDGGEFGVAGIAGAMTSVERRHAKGGDVRIGDQTGRVDGIVMRRTGGADNAAAESAMVLAEEERETLIAT